MNFKAVIFDMDGVITDTMPYHYDAWERVFKLVGIRVTCYDIYLREGQDGFTSLKEMYRKYGRKFDEREARELLFQKEHLFKNIVKLRFVRQARQFARSLHKRGVKLGLVTGTSRHEVKKILPKVFLNLFEASVTGDEVTKGKPYPDPYLKALKLLGIQASQALVIENAPFGIRSAKKAGITCVALATSLPEKYLSEADYIFKTYAQLKEALR